MTDLFERPPAPATTAVRTRSSEGRRRRAEKRRKRRRRRAALIVVAGLIVLGGGAYLAVTHMSSIFSFGSAVQAKDYKGPGGPEVDVTIAQGSTGTAIGETLVENDVVASVKAFTDAYSANPNAGHIQPGTYTLRTRMKASAALNSLIAAEDDSKIMVIPGKSVQQVIETAAPKLDVSVDEFTAALKDTTATGLPPEAKGNYEGWLKPDTYSIGKNETPTSLVQKMVSARISELNSLGVAPKDREAVLTKASLIEKEAKLDSDRPLMAEAINNRLTKGMTLDIDSSVSYGMIKQGKDPSKIDTSDASNSYNLYKHKGLPPGPIANPGSSSIDAVLNPAQGNLLYWCTVNTDTGETKFAATYPEHLKNVDEYRAWYKANKK